MKKIYLVLCCAFLLNARFVQALPDGMSLVSDSLALSTTDQVNYAKCTKPIVVLPDNSLVFTASYASTGDELFICKNGVVSLIKDIVQGPTGSDPKYLTVIGSKVYFTANTADSGVELWVTDGTTDGTHIIKDIYPGTTSSSPFGLTSFKGKLLFFAMDEDSELNPVIDASTAESWLWVSDGTANGTFRIADVPTRTGIDGNYGYIVPCGNKAFFIGYNKDYNETLYTTDGTAAGTAVVTDVYPKPAESGNFKTQAATIDWLYNCNDERVIFRANTYIGGKDYGSEIWTSDGTAAGTKWVGVDYAAGESNGVANNTEFAFPIYYGGKCYFRAKDGVHGCEPGVTDFTAEGTHYVCDINFWNNDPIYDSWGPEFPYIWKGYMFCQANGSYYYPAGTYHDSGYCLWRYNLAEGGVTPTTSNGLTGFQYQSNWTNGIEIYPGNSSDNPKWFCACNDKLFFHATDQSSNSELWVMDSVNATPRKVVDMEGNTAPYFMTAIGNDLYFVTTTTKALYKYSGSTSSLKNVSADKLQIVYTNNDSKLTLKGNDPVVSVTLFTVAGTPKATFNDNQTSYNLSGLPAGMYLVRVVDKNGLVYTSKLIR
jgi:ELWxxDGT repeat protein